MNLVVVSGLSGSGKSVALNALEDAGYVCIDNLPLRLIGALLDELGHADPRNIVDSAATGTPDPASNDAATGTTTASPPLRVAVGVDVRAGTRSIADYPQVRESLRARGVSVTTLFLQASDETLLRRYHHTRRRHPLADHGHTLAEAILAERGILAPIAIVADLQIDTDGLSMHQLSRRVRDRIVGQQPGRLSLLFQSFGFKYGAPIDADLVFDVRHLPNPHYEPGLAEQTGQDPAVIAYLERHADVERMFQSIDRYLDEWVPALLRDHRAYLTVGIGCTGGRHRSVYLAERLAARWAQVAEVDASLRHREFDARGVIDDDASHADAHAPRHASTPAQAKASSPELRS